MTDRIMWDWLVPALIITLSYITAFILTFAVFMPLQAAIVPELGSYASLIFLPHGVRVIAAWLYGWRSLVLLAPGSIITHAYLFGTAGFELDKMLAVSAGVFSAAFSFWLLSRMGLDFRLKTSRQVNWRDVMLAGTLAAVLHVIGATHYFGLTIPSIAAYLIGDVVGMVVSIFALMLIFRFLRLRNGRPRDP
jgi:hypothetical protein